MKEQQKKENERIKIIESKLAQYNNVSEFVATEEMRKDSRIKKIESKLRECEDTFDFIDKEQESRLGSLDTMLRGHKNLVEASRERFSEP